MYFSNSKVKMDDWTKIFSQVLQVKVNGVTDTIFKFGLFCLCLAVVASIFSDKTWVTIILFCFAGLILLTGTILYIFFALKNPEYLRSESYQLKKRAVEILGDNDNANNKNLNNLPSIMNPYYEIDENDKENQLLT